MLKVPCNSTMRRSVQPDQVLSPDVSSIATGMEDTGTKDQTPDMFEENYTELLMKKNHFKFCSTTKDSSGFSLGNSHHFYGGEETSRDQTVTSFVKHIEDDKLSSFLDLEEQKNSQLYESYQEPFSRRSSSQNNLVSQKNAEAECTKQKWYFRSRSSSVGPQLGGKGQKRPNFGFDQIISPTQVVAASVEKATETSFLTDDSSEATTSTHSSQSSSSASSSSSSTLPSISDISCQAISTSFASSSLSQVSSVDKKNANPKKKEANSTHCVSAPRVVSLKFAAEEDIELIRDLKAETIRERRRTQVKEPLYEDTTLPEGWKREVNIHQCQGIYFLKT